MKDVIIRPLTAENFEAAVAMACRVFGNDYERKARQVFLANLKGVPEKPITFVVLVGEKVAGLVWCAPAGINFDVYTFGWMSVDTPFRGRGLGRALVQYAERYIAQDLLRGRPGSIVITDDTQDPSTGFYTKMGYEAGPAIHNGAPVMVKQVNQA